jgi:hypothetical protein
MSSDNIFHAIFIGLAVVLGYSIGKYFEAVDEQRDKFHKTLDAWQARRLDAAERGDGGE